MSFEVGGSVVLLALLAPAGLVIACATIPRWCIRSMSKHALWHLRDDVVDDTLAGRLPAGHAAVKELIARVEWAITESRSFDLLHLRVWVRARRHLPEETACKLERLVALADLTPEQAKRVENYRTRYNSVAIKAILLTSWIGILVVFRFGVPVAIDVFRHLQEHRLRVVVRRATDAVATETNLGRSARTFVTDKGPHREPAVV